MNLSKSVLADLSLISPSLSMGYLLYPCAVTLQSGEVIERVIIRTWQPFEKEIGLATQSNYAVLDPLEIVKVQPSDVRTPSWIVTKLEEVGETSMGGGLDFLLSTKVGDTYLGHTAWFDFLDVDIEVLNSATVVNVISPAESKQHADLPRISQARFAMCCVDDDLSSIGKVL